MSSLVTFKLQQEQSSPPGFRLSLIDSKGAFQKPVRALLTIDHRIGSVWAYGKDSVTFELPPGNYHYIVSAGPAWSIASGTTTIDLDPVVLDIALKDLFRSQIDNWIPADAHVHPVQDRQPDHLAQMCATEDIGLCGIQFWGSYTNQDRTASPPQRGIYRVHTTWVSSDQEIEMHSPWGPWEDSTVMSLQNKLVDMREGFGYRMNAMFYRQARARGCAMIVYQGPTWAQFPVDAALGLVDSVNLCDNYFSLAMPAVGPWGYTYFDRDDPLQRSPYGIAHWIFQHYYRILNAGIALPVSGGSAFPNGGGGGPIGMNRFCVASNHISRASEFYASWRNGQTFATNGPFLLATIDGNSPSKAPISTPQDRSQLTLRVLSNRPIDCLEWVADGRVIAAKQPVPSTGPVIETWETELDLRPYQWVAARCFGESERTWIPEVGHVSPPFLTAHTSPFYLPAFRTSTAARRTAINSLLEHLNWMAAVVREDAKALFATIPYAKGPLSDQEKEEIFSLLKQAQRVYESRLDCLAGPVPATKEP